MDDKDKAETLVYVFLALVYLSIMAAINYWIVLRLG